MSEIIIFPRSERAYSGPFTHPEIGGMQTELNLLEALCSNAQKDLKSIQQGVSNQARWLTIRHLEFALEMAKYTGDPELVALIEQVAEKSQYDS